MRLDDVDDSLGDLPDLNISNIGSTLPLSMVPNIHASQSDLSILNVDTSLLSGNYYTKLKFRQAVYHRNQQTETEKTRKHKNQSTREEIHVGNVKVHTRANKYSKTVNANNDIQSLSIIQ